MGLGIGYGMNDGSKCPRSNGCLYDSGHAGECSDARPGASPHKDRRPSNEVETFRGARKCSCGQPWIPASGLYGTTEETQCHACTLRKELDEARIALASAETDRAFMEIRLGAMRRAFGDLSAACDRVLSDDLAYESSRKGGKR